jgi:hypothetical protein
MALLVLEASKDSKFKKNQAFLSQIPETFLEKKN